MKRKIIRFMSVLMIFSMILSTIGITAEAKSGVQGHWAEKQIAEWVEAGFLDTDDVDALQPDQPMTRLAFIALINRAFGFLATAKVQFTDVKPGSAAYDEVAKASAAGYITGKGNGQFGVHDMLTRQETAVILSKVLKLEGNEQLSDPLFKDADRFAPWSRQAIIAMAANQLMHGYGATSSFMPDRYLTLAEAVVVLGRSLHLQATKTATDSSKEGNSKIPDSDLKPQIGTRSTTGGIWPGTSSGHGSGGGTNPPGGSNLPTLKGKIVYHAYSDYDAWDSQLFLLDLADKSVTNLSSYWNIDHAMNASFSPDGMKMVFMGDDADGQSDANRDWDIYLYDFATPNVQPLNLTHGRGKRDEDPKFAPSGNKIVYKEGRWDTNRDDFAYDLVEMDLNGAVLNTVTDPNNEEEESMPYYAADGQTIYYARGSHANSDIYSISIYGTNKQPVANKPHIQEYYPIVRDQSSIIYTRWVSKTNDNDQLYMKYSNQTEPIRLPFNDPNNNYSDAFPIGSQYTLLSSTRPGGKGGYDVYIADIQSGAIWSLDQYNSQINTPNEELGATYTSNTNPFVKPDPKPSVQEPFVTEVIVRTVNQFKNHQDVVAFMNMAKAKEVSVVNVNVKQDEDDEVPSGHVFYNSSIAPIAAGYEHFDALKDVINEAHKRNISVRAWIPQFHDQAAALKDPIWQMQALIDGEVVPFTGWNGNEYFVNPIHPDVQAYERSIIREVVSKYEVDGVVLDWLRFDNYAMDLSPYTRGKYQASSGVDPIDFDFDAQNAELSAWNAWRTAQIGAYVHEVRADMKQIKPQVELGVYILPPEFIEVGQDVEQFKDDVDFIAPMAYFDDWEFEPSWVYNEGGILSQTKHKVGNGVEIVPTLDNDWTDDEYQEVYGGIRDQFPDVTHLSFFVYGKWDASELDRIQARRDWPSDDWQPKPDVVEDIAAGLPEPWKGYTFRSSVSHAVYLPDDAVFQLRSTDTDIWGRTDSFYYVSQPLQGDGSIIARVSSLEQAGEWAKAGVMIRESLSSQSKHVDMLLTPNSVNGAGFQYRERDKINTHIEMFEGVAVPQWVKLERKGNVFVGYWSSDGVTWNNAWDMELPMAEQVFIGLAYSNPENDESNLAVFDHVSVTKK